MADQQPSEIELRRLAIRAQLGIDQDARSGEAQEPKPKRAKEQATDLPAAKTVQPEVMDAIAEGRPIEEVGPEPTKDPLIIKRRLDGRLKQQPLSEEFKQGLRDAYADDLGVNVEDLAKATGFSRGAIAAALWEHPKTLAAARSKRSAATHDAMEQALYLLAMELRRAIQAGEVQASGKNIRDFMVGFGILVDKLALMQGSPTSRTELIVESLDERKARLTAVLDRADVALGLLTSGRKDPASHSPNVKGGNGSQ